MLPSCCYIILIHLQFFYKFILKNFLIIETDQLFLTSPEILKRLYSTVLFNLLLVKMINTKYNHVDTCRITFSVKVNLRGTLTIYWQCRTFVHELSISESVHCVALWYSVYRYHIITGWVSSFTFYLINPEISTGIELSHNF